MDTSAFESKQNENCDLLSKIPELLKSEPCILGIDEAGRGPVLGPMVYATCVCPVSHKEELANLGCDDSKVLSEEKREELFALLDSNTDKYIGWLITVLSPAFISTSMLSRTKYNLNAISHDTAINLIKSIIRLGVNVTEVYVDTVGKADKYQEKLKGIFPNISITVESKADANYPVVSAASICAKVCRDKCVKNWKFDEFVGDEEKLSVNYGSGYPSDPNTKAWLRKIRDYVFGFPTFVRFSWSTSSKILEKEAASVYWEDDDEEVDEKQQITAYFGDVKKKPHEFFTKNNLTNVEIF